MTALRPAAAAGPGPQTWLYRLSFGTNPTLHLRPPPLRPLHTTAPAPAYQRSRKVKPKPNITRPPPSSKPRGPSTPEKAAKPVAHDTTSPLTSYDNVILLGVPPDYPIEANINRLISHLQNSQLDQSTAEWAQLWDLRCIHRLAPWHFEVISNSIRQILFGKNYPHLGKMALYEPAKYGHLKNMVIESASRGYALGLYALMLKLIGSGRPKDVIDAYERCKEHMREIQGKKKEDLFSWDRIKRLNARLEDPSASSMNNQNKVNVGLKHLLMANIAAHTLMDTLDDKVLFSMLDSHIDLRPSSTFDFKPIDRALKASKAQPQVHKRFRANVDKLVLSLMCYHPNALVARIITLGTRKSDSKLDRLYDRVLEASIGPDAYLKPRELDDFSLVFRNIPIPPVIWLQFMKTFEWKGDVDRIIKMIDVDLPERGLEPNGDFLSSAMLYMAILSQRVGQSSSVRSKARAWVDEYWRRLTTQNWHIEDQPFSRRIRTLSILSFDDPNLRNEITSLYKAAKEGHLGRIHSRTRAAFVEFFIKHGTLNQAWQIFQTFPMDTDRPEDNSDIAFSVFIRRLALGPWPVEDKLKMYKKVTKLFIDSGLPLRPHVLGSLLSVQLQVLNLPMKTIVDLTLDATTDAEAPDPGIQRWTKVLYGMITKWTHTATPTLLEIQAGLYILEKASERKLYGVTRSRLVQMWMSFLGPIAKSTHTSAEQRQEYIDLALDLFPDGGKGNVSISMWMEIITHSFNRHDSAGFGEGYRRWKELGQIRTIQAIWYSKMLDLLIKHDKIDWALDLVTDAWNKKYIKKADGFYLRAKAYGLISQLDLDPELEMEQNRLMDDENGQMKRWKEPIAFVEEYEDEMYLKEEEQSSIDEEDGLDEEDARFQDEEDLDTEEEINRL
ncbi:hypothetical protein I203_103597 [Kwoniella mangroviensis CBS 8507]|uniref:uncharacterized protein n=1 Tax=Kwoniella mangroviensis CBS 8507 TaxID=1296122 RepID=UPI00080CEAEE|nr:uncharacterized protein I203_04306 [Kwoniella mangroviensis CBS 8507]OCF66730.1 hypothetical protein I203_04306 [Kwoniella mangroviensis CBS 8507]